jgi:hypothetical protein
MRWRTICCCVVAVLGGALCLLRSGVTTAPSGAEARDRLVRQFVSDDDDPYGKYLVLEKQVKVPPTNSEMWVLAFVDPSDEGAAILVLADKTFTLLHEDRHSMKGEIVSAAIVDGFSGPSLRIVTQDTRGEHHFLADCDIHESGFTKATERRAPEIDQEQFLTMIRDKVAGIKKESTFNGSVSVGIRSGYSDEALIALREVGDKVVDLNLFFVPVTDGGVQHLVQLNRLERLNLAGSTITDVGMASFSKLRRLKWIDVTGTQVSTKGISEFECRVPGCEVIHESKKSQKKPKPRVVLP